jgi:hypothetical protein
MRVLNEQETETVQGAGTSFSWGPTVMPQLPKQVDLKLPSFEKPRPETPAF